MNTVLVAKDLVALVSDKGSFLDRQDIIVFTAETNDEILGICRKEEIDLIITHLDLPGIRSEELFRTIRASKELQEVSTIMICKDTLATRERCKQCSPNAVVTMPIDIALLHIKVQQFLNVAPRMHYRAALAIAIAGSFKNAPIQFWTENISASGMLIKADEFLSAGDGIFFSFFLPDGAHVSGYGEIARVVPQATQPAHYLYGVRFTNIAPDVRKAIEAAVRR